MEQDHKDKAPVPAEAWDRAAMEKEKDAAKVADKDKDAARAKAKVADKAKVAAKPRGKVVDKIGKPV